MSVIVDAMLPLQGPNVREIALTVWARNAVFKLLKRVKQGFFKTFTDRHALALSEIGEHGCKPLLEAHGDIDPLDRKWRLSFGKPVAEREVIAIGVADREVPETPIAIFRLLHDENAVRALERVKIVGVSDDEIH
jgi:hypothetical protein